MTTTETYGCDRHGEDDAYQGCALCELESLRSRLAEETAIVDRIWDIYGRPTYEQLAGRSIYDLINADRARLAEAEALLREAIPAVQSYARKHGRAFVAAARRNDAYHAAKHADIEKSAWGLADRIRAYLAPDSATHRETHVT